MSVSSLATSGPSIKIPGLQGATRPPELVAEATPVAPAKGYAEPAPGAVTLPADTARSWLAWQCRMVAGVIRGGIFLAAGPGEAPRLAASWPEGGTQAPLPTDIVSQVLAQGDGVIRSQEPYGPDKQRRCDLLASPLLANDRPVGAVVMMISGRSNSQQHAVLQLLQWGGVWLENLVRQHAGAQQEIGAFAANLLAVVLGRQAVRLAAMETVNRLADRFACERVSLGLRDGLSVHLQALSHVARFDPRTELVRGIEAAMEEALDQAATVLLPGDPERQPALTRAHDALTRQQGQGSICTVALHGQSGYVGALTLERAADRPFDKETAAACETLAGLVGPVLEMKQREARPLLLKAGEALMAPWAGLFGAAHLKVKLFLGVATLLLAASFLVQGNYEVTAPATIEGAVRQLLVAPQEGFVKQAAVRAGDVVAKGQLIALLDDRGLQLEAKKWQGEKNKVEQEYQEALAKRERTELSVLRAKIDQLDAELELVAGKIARTRLVAPFDGVVVSGDLSQSLGAPVQTGQVLFEVAPLDSYRVVVEVDEHDTTGLAPGKPGRLVMAALPHTPLAVSVRQVVPVAVSGEGRNFFRVEAALDQPSSLLRPGMRGVARIGIGPRKLFWIWTHALIDRLRLWAWSAGL